MTRFSVRQEWIALCFGKTITFLVTLSLFVVSLPVAALAQDGSAAVARDSAALAEIETWVEKPRRELGIPGLSLAIVRGDQVIFAKGFGHRDFEKQVTVTADTQFAIGSVTKGFTGMTVLMSQDDGKLSLDDSPKKYLPYFI